jgi:hypothetical protein
MAVKMAPYDQSRPIMNLINTTRSRYATSSYAEVACRICPESAVLTTQDAIGAMEEVFDSAFPDPQYRPTFHIGTVSFPVWEAPASESPGSKFKDSLEDILSHTRLSSGAFTIVGLGMAPSQLDRLFSSVMTMMSRCMIFWEKGV